MAWNEPGGDDKDPWGNRKNNDGGPPDLDEVIKNLKNWFNNTLGNKGGSGGSGGSNRGTSSGGGLPGANLGGKGIGLLAGILGIVWLLSGIYVVQPAQMAVITQFGAFKKTTSPGPHWHLPWPFQAVQKVDVEEIRSARLTNQLILTQDENIVDIDLAVQYNIKSAEDYLFNVRGPDRTLEEVVESAVREVIGATALESVITTGRDDVWNTTAVSLQEVLDNYEAGIFVTAVNLERAQPPEQVQAAFSDAIKAREDKERTINEARAYSNQVLPRARGDAQRALEESEAYKTRVEQAALGESERFKSLLAEYKKAPAVTRERLYLEAMETVMSNTSKVMVDNDGGNSLMYLPIDQLVNQNRSEGEGGNGMMNGNSPLNSGSNDSPRFSDLPRESILPSRDDARSRDRGAVR